MEAHGRPGALKTYTVVRVTRHVMYVTYSEPIFEGRVFLFRVRYRFLGKMCFTEVSRDGQGTPCKTTFH